MLFVLFRCIFFFKLNRTLDKLLKLLIKISGTLKSVPNARDADMVIECAVLGSATHILTGAKHLLSLIKYQRIKITRATDIINLCF